MLIPKRFKLLGHEIQVNTEPGLFYNGGRYGEAGVESKMINLCPPSPGVPIPQSSLEHTYLHELLHLCLYHTEQAQLNDNDKFVDLLAGLLHQAFETAEYGESIATSKAPLASKSREEIVKEMAANLKRVSTADESAILEQAERLVAECLGPPVEEP
jgi:hypothetical protein